MAREHQPRSVRYAFGVAAAYGIVTAAYIIVSSTLAADASHSVEELQRLETLKGIAFVTVTTVLVFGGAWTAMRRIEHDGSVLLRRERALLEAEGRVFAGLMAATVAHDANNVLVSVLAELDDLGQDVGEARVASLHAAVTRLVALNRRLAAATRLDATREAQTTDLVTLARDTVTSLRAHAHVRGCHTEVTGDATLVAATNPLLVHQALSNLILNACEASNGTGSVEIEVRRHADEARLTVHDAGPGVAPERRAELFDALVTTKPGGTGLGLFSVKACATALGGRVEVRDSRLGGAAFQLILPISRVNASAA